MIFRFASTSVQARWDWRRVLLVVLLLAAGSDFFLRAPLRLLHGTDWNDYLSPYLQSRAWIHGIDPYAPDTLVKLWPKGKPIFTFVKREAEDGSLAYKRGVPAPYPVSSLAVLAPLALLPWNLSQTLWILLSYSAAGFTVAGLVALAQVKWRMREVWAFAACALAFAPFHTALVTENPVLLAVGIGVLAIWAAMHSRDYLAGIALAIAICLKPQAGLCFLAFFLTQKRWSIAKLGGAVSASIILVSLTRLWLAGTSWVETYIAVSRAMFAPGAINDFTGQNPVWFHMVNLQVAFFPLLGNASAANLCALLVAAVFGFIWLMVVTRSADDADPLLVFSALGIISLLPVYHRFYDSVLLIFPLAWALLRPHPRRGNALATMFLSALFLTPGGVLVTHLAERAHFPAAVVNSWWWRSLIVGHQSWALLLLSMILLRAMMLPGQQAVDRCESQAAELVPQVL